MLGRSQISHSKAGTDVRLTTLKDWLACIDAVAGAELTLASGDASFRRYFRLHLGSGSFIVMDAPPPHEDCLPFIQIAGHFEAMQLNAPRVIDASPEDGFLLLTDLGTTQYLERLDSAPESATRLYADALHALLLMQDRGRAFQSALPAYDNELLQFELSLFHDWLCEKHLGIEFSEADEKSWQSVCNLLANNALDQPQVFVHRDYHSRNLMVTAEDNPGILDFQDAVEGPLTYDLVSLLKDCYVRWPAEQVRGWASDFYTKLDEPTCAQIGSEEFMRYFDLMGAQRHLKAAGIFARLKHRDGKPGFMADVPRTLHYVAELGPQYNELDFLVRLIGERCLPALQGTT